MPLPHHQCDLFQAIIDEVSFPYDEGPLLTSLGLKLCIRGSHAARSLETRERTRPEEA
jgi:hypothetical protein